MNGTVAVESCFTRYRAWNAARWGRQRLIQRLYNHVSCRFGARRVCGTQNVVLNDYTTFIQLPFTLSFSNPDSGSPLACFCLSGRLGITSMGVCGLTSDTGNRI